MDSAICVGISYSFARASQFSMLTWIFCPKISREDLRETLQLITMSNDEDFLEEVLNQVFCDQCKVTNLKPSSKVFQEADSDEDGFILFEDFSKVAPRSALG